MILFGYKTSFSSVLRALPAIGIGLVMLLRTDATVLVVKIIAVFLFAAGVVSLVHGLVRRKDGALPLMGVNTVVDILLGLVLYFWPGFVAGFIVSAVGVVLILFGLLQFIVMFGTVSLLGAGLLPLLLSGVAVVIGVTLLFQPWENTVMGRLAGIALIYYGVTELLSAHRVSKAKKAYEIRFADKAEEQPAEEKTARPAADGMALAKDVEYEKIEDGTADGGETGFWTSDASRPVDE